MGQTWSAWKEEIGYMERTKNIWVLAQVKDCFRKTGMASVSVRWMDTGRGGSDEMEVRSRLMAQDSQGKDIVRDDSFAETPPQEANRMLISREATRRRDGRRRKLMFRRQVTTSVPKKQQGCVHRPAGGVLKVCLGN